MKLITMRATITPGDFHRYVDELDRTELPYSLICTSEASANPMVLEVQLDGSDHNGTEVRLYANGTWSVTTTLVLGSES